MILNFEHIRFCSYLIRVFSNTCGRHSKYICLYISLKLAIPCYLNLSFVSSIASLIILVFSKLLANIHLLIQDDDRLQRVIEKRCVRPFVVTHRECNEQNTKMHVKWLYLPANILGGRYSRSDVDVCLLQGEAVTRLYTVWQIRSQICSICARTYAVAT